MAATAGPAPDTPGEASTAPESFESFKEAQRVTWALGDYPQVARDLLSPLAHRLVAACRISPGQHVLDVGAGSGNVAVHMATAGAHVVAADLTPALFQGGLAEAAVRRVAVEWVEADAEDLPFNDDIFDTVVSCVGVMFAPRHAHAATEMARVCRPGGTIGLISWPPHGTVGDFYAMLAAYLPPPPGIEPPLLWGDPEHLRGLFGDRVEWREHSPEILRVEHFPSPQDFCTYYKANFGPTMRTYAHVADDPGRKTALDDEFLAFARKHAHHHGPADIHYDFEYLLSVGTVRRW
jgi:SAM-dependent methyltransferase